MVLTVLLLGVLYLVFVGALSLYFDGFLPVLGVVGLVTFGQFFRSDRLARTHPATETRVERLRALAGELA